VKHLMDLLATRAMIDGLTGLWNDGGLQRRLDAELSLSARSGRPLAFIVVDLDDFRRLNEEHGHRFGDEVLKAVARTILNDCRAEDVVCRHGADALAMLLPNSTAEQAMGPAERLREAVARIPFAARGVPVTVTCSIGIADNLEDRGAIMLDLADRAVQRAGRAGGNRSVNGCVISPTPVA
jgi:diguanylate cyclase (GGDEF)-like protein